MTQVQYQGSCLCSGVKYEIYEKFSNIIQCHCQKCRKATGTAFATNAPVAKSAFKFIQGEELLNSFQSSEMSTRYFCGQCGSHVYAVRKTDPELYRVRLGLLDNDVDTPLGPHVFVGSKANWDEILDDRPQFEEFPQ